MMVPPVGRTTPPAESAVADWYESATLLDSHEVMLPGGERPTMRALAAVMLEAPPAWFRSLLAIRDAVMRLFAVKTSTQLRAAHAASDRIDFFAVLGESSDEIILGENDRHLDFRLSLLRRRLDASDVLIATTVVHVHNGLGRTDLQLASTFTRR